MSRRWLASALILGVAALVRLPHYDVAWFGYDQIKFMTQARLVLAGHWDVLGPDASGLNIIGPLYSYLLAGLLWIREDPRFLVLFGVLCDVVAAWFVYDIARRLSGPAAAIVAAVSYVTVPTLVIGTRLLWNPTLLPGLVALAWWLAVRYREWPSTWTLIGIAFAAGLMLPLHATGIFHAAGLAVAVMMSRRPTVPQFVVAVTAGLLPLLPVLPRLLGSTSDVGALGGRIAMPTNLIPTLVALAEITLGFPKAFGQYPSADLSTGVFHVQAVVAAAGLIVTVARRTAYWPIWGGLALSLASEVIGAVFYAAAISWHYFIALAPAVCLWIGHVVSLAPRGRLPVAVCLSAMATLHLWFVHDFDRRAIASGLIRVETQQVGIRGPALVGYAPTLRDLRITGREVQSIVPDGATAMLMARGARGELWRETAAEFMTPAAGPRDGWTTSFLLTGPGATQLEPGVRIVGDRVCAFERSSAVWRGIHRPPVAGWELPGFADTDWVALDFPRRITGRSLAGPHLALATWRSPQLLLRGNFAVDTAQPRRAFGMTIRSAGVHWIGGAFVNGVPITGIRDRVLLSSVARTQEWFLDVTSGLRAGENTIAIALDGQVAMFDLDIFEVPCLDTEWYY